MTPHEFIAKWRASTLKESSASQEHFIDLCRLLGEPTPAEADPTGEAYCFERGARKDTGGDGWADVWKRRHFAWEYKGKRADLDAAFGQLRLYALALENPPLLIVSDMLRFRIRTNWTNSISKTYEFDLDDLADAAARDRLKWAFSDPERLRPGETRQSLTEQAAQSFATVAQSLRERGDDPQAVAHFVNRLVFCMFADDVGLLPGHMFTRMLEQARRVPDRFTDLAGALFQGMAKGGLVGFETVDWFNGGLFDDATALPLEKPDLDAVLAASNLDWSEIDPSILGTLFERGLDPDKRAQLGAHYTDRDKIMLLVEPVVIRPWLAEWAAEKAEIAAELERAEAAKSTATRTKRRNDAERRYRTFLNRLRAFTVLDPACGSGNFLYLALQALKDLEHRVQFEAEALGFQRAFPVIGPANVKGIEINPYAAELARVSVWIGEIQWMRRNGFAEARDPILKPLDTIECRDAILTPDGAEPDWPEADVVIGNPPFLGGWRLIAHLGEDYVSRMSPVYAGRVSGAADLVCYWFEKAGQQIALGKARRAGLVATNSIRGGANRKALQRRCDSNALVADDPPEVLRRRRGRPGPPSLRSAAGRAACAGERRRGRGRQSGTTGRRQLRTATDDRRRSSRIRFHAARSVDRAWSCWAFGRWPSTLRTLTAWTWPMALRSAGVDEPALDQRLELRPSDGREGSDGRLREDPARACGRRGGQHVVVARRYPSSSGSASSPNCRTASLTAMPTGRPSSRSAASTPRRHQHRSAAAGRPQACRPEPPPDDSSARSRGRPAIAVPSALRVP